MSEEETPEERRARVKAALGNGPEGYTPEVLKRLANGPIMDPIERYLPAGRLSMAEYYERERSNLIGDGSE